MNQRIIRDLIDAGYEYRISELGTILYGQDAPDSTERIAAAVRAKTAKERIDGAVRAAWLALAGEPIPPGADPVEFLDLRGARR